MANPRKSIQLGGPQLLVARSAERICQLATLKSMFTKASFELSGYKDEADRLIMATHSQQFDSTMPDIERAIFESHS